MQAFQAGCSRLKLPMPASEHLYRWEVLELYCWVYQLWVQLVGVSQIRTIYTSIWQEYGHELIDDFGNILFGEIQCADTISRYYIIVI
jgi:hypothetical protein